MLVKHKHAGAVAVSATTGRFSHSSDSDNQELVVLYTNKIDLYSITNAGLQLVLTQPFRTCFSEIQAVRAANNNNTSDVIVALSSTGTASLLTFQDNQFVAGPSITTVPSSSTAAVVLKPIMASTSSMNSQQVCVAVHSTISLYDIKQSSLVFKVRYDINNNIHTLYPNHFIVA